MDKIIVDFLAKNWKKDLATKIQISPVPRGQKGDLALSFFDIVKIAKYSPAQIATEVAEVLEKCPEVEKTEVVGPYLNLFFNNSAFFEKVFETPLKTDFLKKKKIMVEYSQPNTNKPIHLGHMRNHALGISLSNILEAAGAKVVRINLVNDRGVHICKSMLAYQKFGNGKTPESTGKKGDHLVGDFYVRFEAESKKDPTLAEQVQQMLVKWEEGDVEVRQLWERMRGWTLDGIHQTYQRQEVWFDKEYCESQTYLRGKKIVENGLKKEVFKRRADGAVVIDLTSDGLDEKVVLRADGTSVYITQDLGSTDLKQEDYHPDQQIWVVADEQNYHFKVLFLCLEKLGILDTNKLLHLGYGLVNLPDGRMKSREGNVVDADALMDELSTLALDEIEKRDPEISESDARKAAEQIMNGAWKFYLLSTSPRKTITFETEKSISFEGATGPYLQYAGVRLRSIFRKAEPLAKDSQKVAATMLQDEEKGLGVKILEFPKVLDRAAETKNPTYLVTYLLELGQDWSSYYAEHSILNAESEDLKIARLALAKKVFEVLEKGLGILGIEVPERM